MTAWTSATVDVTVCPECGDELAPYRATAEQKHWLDADKQEADTRAHALLAHRHHKHRVAPAVGDLVTYTHVWNGLTLTSEVYRVAAIYENYDLTEFARSLGAELEPKFVTRYALDGLTARDRGCTPNTGLEEAPCVFEIVKDAPPVEGDLFDLLDWNDESEDAA